LILFNNGIFSFWDKKAGLPFLKTKSPKRRFLFHNMIFYLVIENKNTLYKDYLFTNTQTIFLTIKSIIFDCAQSKIKFPASFSF